MKILNISEKKLYRMAVALACFTGFFLIWANLAVGLIGSEDNPANLLYVGVIVIGVGGAFLSGLRAKGMVRTMLALAVAQFLVPIIALLIWKPEINIGVAQVIGVNAMFIVLWLVSGLLFERAEGKK